MDHIWYIYYLLQQTKTMKKLFTLLAIVLVVTSRRLYSHYYDTDRDLSHYSSFNRDGDYPSHYYDDEGYGHY